MSSPQSLQTPQVFIDVKDVLIPLSTSTATGRTHTCSEMTRCEELRCRRVKQLNGKGIHIDTLIKYQALGKVLKCNQFCISLHIRALSTDQMADILLEQSVIS